MADNTKEILEKPTCSVKTAPLRQNAWHRSGSQKDSAKWGRCSIDSQFCLHAEVRQSYTMIVWPMPFRPLSKSHNILSRRWVMTHDIDSDSDISSDCGLCLYTMPSPGGSGKTYTIARAARFLAGQGKRVLIVQPTKDLIEKTIEKEIKSLFTSDWLRGYSWWLASPVR